MCQIAEIERNFGKMNILYSKICLPFLTGGE